MSIIQLLCLLRHPLLQHHLCAEADNLDVLEHFGGLHLYPSFPPGAQPDRVALALLPFLEETREKLMESFHALKGRGRWLVAGLR